MRHRRLSASLIPGLLALLTVALALAFTPGEAMGMTKQEYWSKVDSFVNDGRYCHGASAPNCYDYATAFTSYMYGISNPRSGAEHNSATTIQTGDVVWGEATNTNGSITQHWFVVLERNGDSLWTAEGGYGGTVFISNRYSISNFNIADSHGCGFSFWLGYHFDTGGATTRNADRDPNPPTVTDFHVGELREGAFTVLAKVIDDQELKSVRYAIWTEKDGQDDIEWQGGNCFGNDNVYWARVNFSDHNGERGKYIIHCYAADAAGNEVSKGITYEFDSEGPVISDVQVSDVSDTGYTISCRVADAEMDVLRVQFPTWTLYNGQDDLVQDWGTSTAVRGTLKDGVATFRVNFSEHDNQKDVYRTHIYAYDTLGNVTSESVPDQDFSQRNGEATDLPTDTAFLLIPLCSQTRGLMSDSIGNGATLQLSAIDASRISNFQFKFIKDASGEYAIQSAKDNNYYIHVASGNTLNWWETYGSNNSNWIPERNADGSYSFYNPAWKTYIDIQYAQDADGVAAIHYPGNGGNAQKFHLVPVGKSLSASDVVVTCPERVTLEDDAAEPEITVEYLGIALVEGEDYRVSYADNDRPGTATATITSVDGTPSSSNLRGYRGYYTGSRSVTFTVEQEAISNDGWVDLPNGKRGYRRDGELVKGWMDLDGSKYYFDSDGAMVTGWMDLGSSKYYFQPDGSMSVGWTDVEVDGKAMHYYFNPASGNLVRGTWFKIDGKTYYFRPSGNLATGWATIDDNGTEKKYYLDEDGQLVTGWRDIVNAQGTTNHYYFRPSGAMATGWATIDGEKYWFRPSGNMATGWADVDDAYKRYFDEGGHMLTGWQEIGGRTYYFRASGAMQTGKAVIDGTTYVFSDKGVLVG